MIFQPQVGQVVKVLEPFDETYPGTYSITEVIMHEDGQQSCLLDDIEGAFDPRFLEQLEV